MEYEIYTDGSCRENPGKGGIGVAVYHNNELVNTISRGYRQTTNNRMELRAVIEALKGYKGNKITLWTDSEYVQKGITEWMRTWKNNGWMRISNKKEVSVKNVDLWKQIDALLSKDVTVKWLRGHADSEGNILADSLAVEASAGKTTVKDTGFEG